LSRIPFVISIIISRGFCATGSSWAAIRIRRFAAIVIILGLGSGLLDSGRGRVVGTYIGKWSIGCGIADGFGDFGGGLLGSLAVTAVRNRGIGCVDGCGIRHGGNDILGYGIPGIAVGCGVDSRGRDQIRLFRQGSDGTAYNRTGNRWGDRFGASSSSHINSRSR
jgi:hypothetical protein